MAKDLNVLIEKKKKLLEDVAAVEDQIREELKARQDELAELARTAGIEAPKRGRKTSSRICGNCGAEGHNARTCPEPKKSKKKKAEAAA